MRATLLLLWALFLPGCATVRFNVPGAADEAAYTAEHPLYAEFCALSQIKKHPGFGADIQGEIGGHAVFYLNGACRDEAAHYPVLRACRADEPGGTGLSMNAHFRNAKWVAVPGRSLFFQGLPPGQPVTRASYTAVREQARRAGIYDGVVFNDWVFADKPAGFTDETWRYEVSIATDYAIALGRGRYCTRVPVNAAQMVTMIAFLNRQNEPYRTGRRVFEWSVFNDNCIHLAHNALAAAGLWREWPTERPLALAVFDFPVPRNEFVNLARRLNDEWLPDPGAVYHDVAARNLLLRHGQLPTRPGGLVEAQGPITPNQVYATDLKLIFYDDPITGRYQRRFDRIFSEPRYLDATANRAHFATLARRALSDRRPLAWWLARPPYRDDPAGFTGVYDAYYAWAGRLATLAPQSRATEPSFAPVPRGRYNPLGTAT